MRLAGSMCMHWSGCGRIGDASAKSVAKMVD